MGEVYKARDTRLHRLVALKFLPGEMSRDRLTLERFRREACAASALNHPAICTVYDVGEQDGEPYIAMEYLDGQTLARRIQGRPLPPAQVVAWGLELADGLDAAHGEGIVHRDIKPGNIVITSRGHAKILDFGIAKLIEPGSGEAAPADSTEGITIDLAGLTDPGSTVGTVAYMSPEQARGESLDHRSDLFSLGAVFYEMATGRRPFEGETAAVLFDAILNRQPVSPSRVNPAVPAALERVIARALEKDRDSRYSSAAALRRDLEDARRTLEKSGRAVKEPAGPSVAVLYLENLSRASEDEYFRDGMTEDITTELTKIKSLRVFPRAAVSSYRDKSAPAREVGDQLGATHVLGGTIRRAGDRLRVTVQMVETGTGHSVWAERYDREMKDVFEVQEEIARSIAEALRLSLTHEENETIARKPTADLHAYDYFLRGRTYTRQQRRDFALEMFEHALALDPAFALAHAGIANVCAMQYYLADRNEHWLERATAACNRAFALEPRLPEAFVARARILYAQGQYAPAVESAREAIAIKRDCESSWDILGRALFSSDRWQEAADLVEAAIEANGEDYNLYISYGNALGALGREDDLRSLRERQLTALERQLEWVPEDTRARMILAVDYATSCRREDAIRELEKVLSLGTSDSHTIYNAACVYGTLNMKTEALSMLRRAVEEGYSEWDNLARDPDLTCLRDEAEFQRLLARRGGSR